MSRDFDRSFEILIAKSLLFFPFSPGSQTIPVEDVAAGQLLGGGGGHLLPADPSFVRIMEQLFASNFFKLFQTFGIRMMVIIKPADDAHVVCGGKLLSRGVRIKGVHIVDGPS